MACFLVSAAEAVVVTAVEKAEEKKEEKLACNLEGSDVSQTAADGKLSVPFSRKLKWLSWMLWGGVLLLAFEHVWHGEVVPWFPFLTAMSDPAATEEMLHEIATVGVGMAALITVVWGGICLAADSIVRRVHGVEAA